MIEVLLIDGDHRQLGFFSRAVRHFPEPIRCIYADGADDAYKILHSYQPYMVIVDLDMHGADAVGCIREILSIKKAMPVTVVACSDEMDGPLCGMARDAGAAGYFRKARSVAELVRCLSPYLSMT